MVKEGKIDYLSLSNTHSLTLSLSSYGEVFKAEWRGFTVAVKRLPSSLLENKDFLKDFNREAAIMSALRHPNTIQVRHLSLSFSMSSHLHISLLVLGYM